MEPLFEPLFTFEDFQELRVPVPFVVTADAVQRSLTND
jgi:hypothetical protein